MNNISIRTISNLRQSCGSGTSGTLWSSVSHFSYDKAEEWQNLVRRVSDQLAINHRIPIENFSWYAAFHNESYHPHIHILMYSNDESADGYIPKKGIDSSVPNLGWISRELVYADGTKKTPDLLVEENGICIMFDTKAKSPGLKLRTFVEKEIESEINIYAHNILQIYHRIRDYMNGEFSTISTFEINRIFGVSVVLEDSFVSRELIYKRVFQMLIKELGENCSNEIEFIHSHIKVLSLRQIEGMVLRSRGLSNILVTHAKDKTKWNDVEIGPDYFEGETPEILKRHTDRLFGIIASFGYGKASV